MSDFRFINSPEDLAEFADEFKLRPDWHEPDEQNISAHTYGTRFDNAMGPGDLGFTWTDKTAQYRYDALLGPEINVVINHTHIYDDGSGSPRPAAVINLADLLAWASRPYRQAAD